MPLDPQARLVIDVIDATGLTHAHRLPPVEARALMDSLVLPSDVEVAEITNRTIPGPAGEIPVRVYRPSDETELPLLVYFHGGGFTTGSLETHDNVCRRLAVDAGCVVMAVAYRLAPEHPFPAAVDDSVAATSWASEHAAEVGGDPARLAVGGDSAGGNLAAVVALTARDAGGPPIAYQLLVYPVTNQTRLDWPSNVESGEGYFLTTEAMASFRGHYLPDEGDWTDWRAAPLEAEDLGGLPPAFVLAAECDPLRDQDDAYARRLQEAGVKTEYHLAECMFHGFFGMHAFIPAAQPAWDAAVDALRRAFEE